MISVVSVEVNGGIPSADFILQFGQLEEFYGRFEIGSRCPSGGLPAQTVNRSETMILITAIMPIFAGRREVTSLFA